MLKKYICNFLILNLLLLVIAELSFIKAALADDMEVTSSMNYQQNSALRAEQYQSQELEFSSRILASKKKSYPALDDLEELLYPKHDFKEEHPAERLERLEIAVFAVKQSGSAAERVKALERETLAWQIQEASTADPLVFEARSKSSGYPAQTHSPRTLDRKIRQPYGYSNPNYSPETFQGRQYQVNPYQAKPYQARSTRQVDYDYKNYQLISPVLRDLTRKGMNSMFTER